MEGRVAKLEAHVEHIRTDIGEVKSDLRHLLVGLIGGFLVLLGAGVSGYLLLDKDLGEISTSTTILLERTKPSPPRASTDQPPAAADTKKSPDE